MNLVSLYAVLSQDISSLNVTITFHPERKIRGSLNLRGRSLWLLSLRTLVGHNVFLCKILKHWGMWFGIKGWRTGHRLGTYAMTVCFVTSSLQCNIFCWRTKFQLFLIQWSSFCVCKRNSTAHDCISHTHTKRALPEELTAMARVLEQVCISRREVLWGWLH